MIGAFFTGRYVFGFVSVGALLLVMMYAIGVITAIIAAFVLKRTLLKAPPPPFVMELPPYRLPEPSHCVPEHVDACGLVFEESRHGHPDAVDHSLGADELPATVAN